MVLAYMVYRKFSVLVPIKDVLKILLAALGAYLILVYVHLPGMLLPINYLLSMTVYVTILLITQGLNQQDFQMAWSVIPGFITRPLQIWKTRL
jgi:hypothetical protein